MARKIEGLLVQEVAQSQEYHHVSHDDCMYLVIEEIQEVLRCWKICARLLDGTLTEECRHGMPELLWLSRLV